MLEIYDNSEEGKNKNCIVLNCFKTQNTIGMYNYVKQQRNDAIQLEYSLFESYIEAIERKVSVI